MPACELKREIRLPRPIDEVFDFFGDARNLQTITPPWLHFQILTPGDTRMQVGTRIDYRIRLHGVPIRWRSSITAWEPPNRFVDEQISGPYRLWIHEHLFRDEGAATVVSDNVRYAVRGGAVIDQLFVRPDLERIFDYRHKRLREMFG
jgi:ligand-binding SRPBCC domain-containing protein